MLKNLSSKQRWGYLFISPWIIYSIIFLVYPMILSFKYSFLSINLLQPEKVRFVGFENWIAAATDHMFWKSVFNVFFNQSMFIVLTFVFAMLLAVLLNEIKFAGSIFRTVYFIPYITSVTVAMLIFTFISSPQGPIQLTMMKLGWIGQPVFWKATKWLPMMVLAIFNSWKWFGVQMIIFLGGIASIDKQIYEAADIDGVNWKEKFFQITLPLLKPQIVFVLTMNLINGLQMFTEVFMNFDLYGGPFNSALTPVLYLYDKGFDKMEMGTASAIGLLLALVIFTLYKILNKILKVGAEEEN